MSHGESEMYRSEALYGLSAERNRVQIRPSSFERVSKEREIKGEDGLIKEEGGGNNIRAGYYATRR